MLQAKVTMLIQVASLGRLMPMFPKIALQMRINESTAQLTMKNVERAFKRCHNFYILANSYVAVFKDYHKFKATYEELAQHGLKMEYANYKQKKVQSTMDSWVEFGSFLCEQILLVCQEDQKVFGTTQPQTLRYDGHEDLRLIITKKVSTLFDLMDGPKCNVRLFSKEGKFI